MSTYRQAADLVAKMKVGQTKVIEVPENLPFFRKVISERSKYEGKKFTTRIIDGKLHIIRVKWSNIYTKEVE